MKFLPPQSLKLFFVLAGLFFFVACGSEAEATPTVVVEEVAAATETPEPTETATQAIVTFLSWAYPRSEAMITEAASLPRP